jgi:hypothetical protein
MFAAPALAQPAAQTCDVRIVRAPDAVRTAVQTWLDGEHCNISLEVRIIPTDGGLYLLSRDPLGRVHERVVPDAQAAGMLIASWAADDGIAPPVIAPPAPAPAPVEPEPELRIAPPSSTTVHKRMHHATPTRRRTRWASLDAGGGLRGGGVRTSVDIFTYGNWLFGATSALTTNRLPLGGYPYITMANGGELYLPSINILDARVLATAGRNVDLGDTWHARATIGLGVGVTSVTGDGMDDNNAPAHVSTQGIVLDQSASVSFAHDLGNEWGLEAGVDVSYFDEHIYLEAQQLNRNQFELLVFGGLRHQL